MEPRYNEGPRDWGNLFLITGFFFICFAVTEITVKPMTSLVTGSLYLGSTVVRHVNATSNT